MKNSGKNQKHLKVICRVFPSSHDQKWRENFVGDFFDEVKNEKIQNNLIAAIL